MVHSSAIGKLFYSSIVRLGIPTVHLVTFIRFLFSLRHAIRDMAVRGAPAIAIAGALALAVELVKKQATFTSADAALQHITERLEYLVSR